MQSIRVRLQRLFIVGAMVCVGIASNVSCSTWCNWSAVTQKSVNNNICSDRDLDSRFDWYDGLKAIYFLFHSGGQYLSAAELDDMKDDVKKCLIYGIECLSQEIGLVLQRHNGCARILYAMPTLEETLVETLHKAEQGDIDEAMCVVETIYIVFREIVKRPVVGAPLFKGSINFFRVFREKMENMTLDEEAIYGAVAPGYCAECKKPFLI